MMRMLLGTLVALLLVACASMGPMFPTDVTPPPPDFDRSDCCRDA